MHGSKYVTKTVFVLAKNDFRKSFYMKPCVWLRMENRVFRKIIYFDHKIAPLTWKIFSAYVLPSNHFRRRAKRERERERTHKHTNKEKEREIAPLSSRLRWLDRRPHPLHVTVRSRHEPTNQSTHPSSSPMNPRTNRATIGLVILIFFCFDFCFLCCLYASIIYNNICLDPKKM